MNSGRAPNAPRGVLRELTEERVDEGSRLVARTLSTFLASVTIF